MIVLDTDHISVLQHRDAPTATALRERFQLLPGGETVVTTAITVEEQTRSWLGLIRRYIEVHRQIPYYDRLTGLFDFFAEWTILPFDRHAADEFVRLKNTGIRVSTMDLKIAATVLANDGTLLSRNARDFDKVPGLRTENWLP
jgi:tRNA(fMet)-specific endonuclease VapC